MVLVFSFFLSFFAIRIIYQRRVHCIQVAKLIRVDACRFKRHGELSPFTFAFAVYTCSLSDTHIDKRTVTHTYTHTHRL